MATCSWSRHDRGDSSPAGFVADSEPTDLDWDIVADALGRDAFGIDPSLGGCFDLNNWSGGGNSCGTSCGTTGISSSLVFTDGAQPKETMDMDSRLMFDPFLNSVVGDGLVVGSGSEPMGGHQLGHPHAFGAGSSLGGHSLTDHHHQCHHHHHFASSGPTNIPMGVCVPKVSVAPAAWLSLSDGSTDGDSDTSEPPQDGLYSDSTSTWTDSSWGGPTSSLHGLPIQQPTHHIRPSCGGGGGGSGLALPGYHPNLRALMLPPADMPNSGQHPRYVQTRRTGTNKRDNNPLPTNQTAMKGVAATLDVEVNGVFKKEAVKVAKKAQPKKRKRNLAAKKAAAKKAQPKKKRKRSSGRNGKHSDKAKTATELRQVYYAVERQRVRRVNTVVKELKAECIDFGMKMKTDKASVLENTFECLRQLQQMVGAAKQRNHLMRSRVAAIKLDKALRRHI